MIAAANIRPAVTPAPLTGAVDPHAGFVLILQDERGLIYIGATENALLLLDRMRADGLVINDRRVLRSDWTPHARSIAASLAKQFSAQRTADDAPWFAADWPDVQTAYHDRDITTGRILRTGDFIVGDQVHLTADQNAIGELRAFSQDGPARKAHVRFHKPVKGLATVPVIAAWCPLSQLKALVPVPGVAA